MSTTSLEHHIRHKVIAGILGIVLGSIGTHRFYLGDVGIGVAYAVAFAFGLVTTLLVIGVFVLGFVAAVAVVDGLVMLAMKDETFDAKYNKAAIQTA